MHHGEPIELEAYSSCGIPGVIGTIGDAFVIRSGLVRSVIGAKILVAIITNFTAI